MRRMILRMIATGSLTAFSSTALPGLPSQARGAASATANGPVQQARASQVQAPAQAAPQLQSTPGATTPSTTRAQPRGSVLDLSV